MLLNKDVTPLDCWKHACELIDYSLPEYIVVNKYPEKHFGRRRCHQKRCADLRPSAHQRLKMTTSLRSASHMHAGSFHETAVSKTFLSV